MRALAIAVALVAACKGKDKSRTEPKPAPPSDADEAASDAATWPELDGYPLVDAVRTIALPSKPDVPRFDVGGPLLVGDLAVVASSQFGFLGVDWRTGQILWTKPAGGHVAPPVRWRHQETDSIALLGDCIAPPKVADGEILLACLRIVTRAGVDEAYVGVRGTPADLGDFATSFGPQRLYALDAGPGGARSIRWTRGEHAANIDPISGVAKRSTVGRPPIVATWLGKRWDISHVDGKIVAMQDGKKSWGTDHEYTALIGTVQLEGVSPFVRIINARMFGDQAEVHLHDVDATGSMRGTFARPLPGVQLLGWDSTPVGDTALAVRLDTSLRRDYVVGYAPNALLLWVWRLPETPRADPVGVAVASDAVVVFHDGDSLTILPEVSAPATTPGAAARPSDSTTP